MTMHHLSAEEIAAFLDGECSTAERKTAQQHLEACADCRRIADDQRFIKTLMRSLPEPELPRSFVLTDDHEQTVAPLSSPGITAPGSMGMLVKFEPIVKFVSIAAVLALLVLGGAQIAGVGESDTTNNTEQLSETNAPADALQEQEPALARGEVREQGESAAAGAAEPLTTNNALVDTPVQASDNGLTLIEITTIGVGIVALASIASWILIHYRAGQSGNVS